MTPQLNTDLLQALHANDDELEVVDPSTNRVYVIVAKERWSSVTACDDGEPSTDEMLAAAGSANAGPEGWDAPGMEVYDGPAYDNSTSQDKRDAR